MGKDTARLFDKRLALSVAEVAKALGRSTGAVYMLVHRDMIPYRKHGRRVVFIPEEIRAWLNSGDKYVS